MQKRWRLFTAAWAVILVGCLIAYFTQTADGVKMKDVRFVGDNGQLLSAYLYVPANATAETPAPGVLAVHGYINSREVQHGFATELARRGVVVLALDESGHGYSEGAMGANGFGGPAGLRYLRSLDIVDKDNIGLEGHSMGGWTVLAAAAAYPDDYKAVVLEGSSTGAPFAKEGSLDWPRNLAVVFSKFDEFSQTMWGTARALDVASGDKMKAVFGTEDIIVEGQIYGDVAAGTARVLYQPATTHPGDHLNGDAIGKAVSWFQQTLDGVKPLDPGNQIWFTKEIGTLLGWVGFIMLLFGTFELLLGTPYFAQLRQEPTATAYEKRDGKWWLLFALSAIVPVITFYPLYGFTASVLPASALLPQIFATQAVVWALFNGIVFALVGLFVKGREVTFDLKILPSALIALATVGVGMIALLLADYFFQVDFRFWFVGLKPLTASRFWYAVIYFIPFFAYFALALRGLHKGLSVSGDNFWAQYATNTLALMGGILVFLAAQYIWLFMTGLLLTPTEPLNTVVFIQFIPVLFIAGLIGTFTYRRTASWLPGALISALFVSWYVVAGQAMLYAS